MSEAVASANPLVPAKGVGIVRGWLIVIAAMVYAMILVGGATRLTDFGLLDHRMAAAARRHTADDRGATGRRPSPNTSR